MSTRTSGSSRSTSSATRSARLEVTPPTAHVTIPSPRTQTKTLPVNPIITGTPAAGFEIESVTVNPQVALVARRRRRRSPQWTSSNRPDPDDRRVGRRDVEVALALPTGIVAVDDDPVTVTVTLRPVTGDAHVHRRAPPRRREQHAVYKLSVDQRPGHDRRFGGGPRPAVRRRPGHGPRRHRPQDRDPRGHARRPTCRSGPRSSPSARRPSPSPSARPRITAPSASPQPGG